MLDWLLAFLLEFILPVVAEFLCEALLPFLPSCVYRFRLLLLAPLAGAGFAGVSLLVLPHPLIRDSADRLLAVGLIPLLFGLFMTAMGFVQIRLDRPRPAFQYFLPSFAFALLFVLVRFRFAS